MSGLLSNTLESIDTTLIKPGSILYTLERACSNPLYVSRKHLYSDCVVSKVCDKNDHKHFDGLYITPIKHCTNILINSKTIPVLKGACDLISNPNMYMNDIGEFINKTYYTGDGPSREIPQISVIVDSNDLELDLCDLIIHNYGSVDIIPLLEKSLNKPKSFDNFLKNTPTITLKNGSFIRNYSGLINESHSSSLNFSFYYKYLLKNVKIKQDIVWISPSIVLDEQSRIECDVLKISDTLHRKLYTTLKDSFKNEPLKLVKNLNLDLSKIYFRKFKVGSQVISRSDYETLSVQCGLTPSLFK